VLDKLRTTVLAEPRKTRSDNSTRRALPQRKQGEAPTSPGSRGVQRLKPQFKCQIINIYQDITIVVQIKINNMNIFIEDFFILDIII
jgi:hypothetical protein